MTDTPLDRAHTRMEAAPEDDALRLGFYERLADAELFLLLDAEPERDQIAPRVFDTAEGRFVLVFDRELRLTEFTGGPAPYAAISGRAAATMIAGQGLGLGLNLGVAPSAILIPAEAVDWLAETLARLPSEVSETPERIAPPGGLPERLIEGLDAKLATAQGLAAQAILAAVTYRGGRPGHLLAFIDALPGAEDTLARAAAEALVFSGLDAGELDVGFFRSTDAVAARLVAVGLRFDLPPAPEAEGPSAPGLDPDRLPRLR